MRTQSLFRQIFPISRWLIQNTSCHLVMRCLFKVNIWKAAFIEVDDLSIRVGHQDRRVSGNDELTFSRIDEGVNKGKQCQLPLRRERRLRLVEQEDPLVQTILEMARKASPWERVCKDLPP
jgi:hypothetical protein